MLRTNLINTLSGLLALVVLSPLFAQSGGVIEEVVVTATKREQTLQEVPVAVSVVGLQVMEEAQVNDMLDLQFMVPSLRVTQLQTTANTNFVIRGFGNGANNVGVEPSVGVFIDGVYRSRSAAAIMDLPNIERIEVLRGPQNTLFGKNASAGVISVVTAAPSMDEFTGKAAFTYGNYNQVIVKGDLSGPISDTVGFSLAAYGNKRDGYFKNLHTGSKLNERDRWGVRGQLLWLPTDNVTLRMIADYDKLDEKCCGVANILAGSTAQIIQLIGGNLVANDPFAYENYYDFDPINELKNSGISLQADINFDNDVLLTSITSYRTQDRLENPDVDFTSAALVGRNLGDFNIDTFTQELRLSKSTDKLDWMAGLFYFDETVKYTNDLAYDFAFRPYADIASGFNITALEQTLQAFGLLPPGVSFFGTGQGVIEDTGQDDQTISLFGQANYHVTDRMTLTGGLNWTKVDKEAFVSQSNTDVYSALDMVQIGFGLGFFNLTGLPPTVPNIVANPQAAAIASAVSTVECTAETGPACNPLLGRNGLQFFQFLPPFLDFPNAVESGKTSDDKVTWTLRAAFQATDNINVYGTIGTGFKATSWNLSRDSRPFARDIPAIQAAGIAVTNLTSGTRYAGPEEATVYELGMKSAWGSSILNVAIFQQEIKGFQSNIFTGVGFRLSNAGKQTTKGIEVEGTWLPTENWRLSFAGTYLDAVYDEFPVAEGPAGPVDLSGTKVPGVPEFAMNASATYYFDIGSSQAFIRGEYIYESEVPVVENVPASLAMRKVSTINASAGLAWSNGVEVTIWGRNLTNDQYLLSAFPGVAQPGTWSGYPNQPRTYGITLRTRF